MVANDPAFAPRLFPTPIVAGQKHLEDIETGVEACLVTESEAQAGVAQYLFAFERNPITELVQISQLGGEDDAAVRGGDDRPRNDILRHERQKQSDDKRPKSLHDQYSRGAQPGRAKPEKLIQPCSGFHNIAPEYVCRFRMTADIA